MATIAPLVSTPKPPPEIANLKAWLIWNFEEAGEGKKQRKVPRYFADNTRRRFQNGSHDDMARLGTFREALAAQAKYGADGIGFACLEHCNIVALDFDNCVDADGRINPEVLGIASMSYSELSPSGRGVRSFFMGHLADKKSLGAEYNFGFEVFCTKGFVTYTGNVLPECELLGDPTVEPVTQAVLSLYVKRFGNVIRERDPDRALESVMPTCNLTFDQMEGYLKLLDPDMPEPDWLRVGWAIAHETDGSDEGLALFDRWSRGDLSGHSALKYRAEAVQMRFERGLDPQGKPVTFRSIIRLANAVKQEKQKTEAVERFRVMPASEFAALPPPKWIVRGLVPEADLGVIYGEPGSGKSFFVFDLVSSIARGVPWRESPVSKRGVVYVAAEGSRGFRVRVAAYESKHGPLPENFGFVPEAPNFLDDTDPGALIKTIKAFGQVGIVVLDTLAQITPGGNENSGEDMGKALGHCKRLSEALGCLVILVHHSGKDATKGARGWSGLKAAADFELSITREGEIRRAKVTKLKDGEDGMAHGFRLETVNLGEDSDGEPVSSCVVSEVDLAEIDAEPVVRGKWQQAVYQAAQGMVGLDENGESDDGVERGALIDNAILLSGELPPKDSKRDRRRDNVKRALHYLLRAGVLYELDSMVFLQEKSGS